MNSCQGEPLSRIEWDTRRKGLCVRALATSSTPSFEACSEAVGRGDVGVAFRQLHRGVTEAAAVAGIHTRRVSHPNRPFTAQHVPFFDRECKELKRD